MIDNTSIIRPGVIIGGGDVFLKRLLPIFKMSFFVPLFGDGTIKFQPVFIDDVSLAVEKIIKIAKNLLIIRPIDLFFFGSINYLLI